MTGKNEPDLMRLFLGHCAMGFALSVVFVAMLLWFDIAGLGALVKGSDVGWLAVFLLWFFNGTVFGSVQFAITVMLNSDDRDNDDDDDQRGMLVPVVVRSHVSRRAMGQGDGNRGNRIR